jgi:hypothetical protein
MQTHQTRADAELDQGSAQLTREAIAEAIGSLEFVRDVLTQAQQRNHPAVVAGNVETLRKVASHLATLADSLEAKPGLFGLSANAPTVRKLSQP